MAQKEGVNTVLVHVSESTWGVTPGTPAGHVIPIVSESLKCTRTREKDPTILAGRDFRRPGNGPQNVAGDIKVMLNPLAHGWLLRDLLGAPTTTALGGGKYSHAFRSTNTPPVGSHFEREIDGEWYLYNGNRCSKASFEVKESAFIDATFGYIGATESIATTPVDSSVADESFTGSGLDDLESGGTYTGSGEKQFKILIDTEGTPDKFSWSNDGGATYEATGVSITGSAQTLEDGVTVAFGATTGHTEDEYWTFSAGPENYDHYAFDLGGADIVVEEGGGAITSITNVTISIDNETQAAEPVIGAEGVTSGVTHGKCSISGTIRCIYESNALYLKAKNSTESSIEFSVQFGDGGGGVRNQKITFLIPELLYDQNATTADTPRGLYVEQPFTAYYDNSTEETALQITLINTISSYA